MKKKNVLLICTLGAITLGLAACGGGSSSGGGDSGNVTISASVGSSYTVATAPSFMDYVQDILFGKRAMAISSDVKVDKVVALPSNEGGLSPADFEGMKTVSIDSSGDFSLSLEKSYNWVLLLIDSTASDPNSKVVGYIAATIDGDNTLIAFPGSEFSTNLDLGTLESSDRHEARSSTSGILTAASFDLSLDDLKAVAKSDDGYKHVINLYLNYNPTSGAAYQAQLSYNWNSGTITSTENITPSHASISNYSSPLLGVGIETANMSEALKDGICSGITTAEMVPPGSISNSDGSRTWDAVNGFRNDADYATNCTLNDTGCMNMGALNSSHWLQNFGSEQRYYCYDADFNMQVPSGFSNSLIGFGWGNLAIPNTGMPTGLWTYKVGGNEVAWFDLEVASPISVTGIISATPIPGLRINSNVSTGEITGVEVTWFQYDASQSQYVPLSTAQADALDALVYNSYIDIMDEDGPDPANTPETIHLYDNDAPEMSSGGLHNGSSISFLAGTWYMPGSAGDVTGKLVPSTINVGLHILGVQYNFGWSQP